MVMKKEDPLVGALPKSTANTTGSPALAGQPASITGATGTMPEMPRTSSAGPALAPAPAPGGTADVGGAPLSIDGASEQAAGAVGQTPPPEHVQSLDLVKDRGKPEEYWQENMNKLGSRSVMAMMGDAANAASGRTGEQANMDAETVRRDGVRVNEAMGMGNDPDVQDATIEQMVYKPMAQLLTQERDTGTISSDEADFRLATSMAQVEGPDTEDELKEIFVTATKRMSGSGAAGAREGVQEEETGEGLPETEIPEEKEGAWQRFKNWWKLGTEDVTTWHDPETGDEVPEGTEGAEKRVTKAEDVEVTKFMGGMTRQELGTFVFQWGALMMANAEEGFGGAMGIASLGALEGHQARQAQEFEQSGVLADRALRERQVAAAEYDTKVSDRDTLLERYLDPETGEFKWREALDKDGNPITVKDPGDRPYGGKGVWEAEEWEALGYDPQTIAEIQQGAMGQAEIYDTLFQDLVDRRAKALEEEKMNLPDNMRQKIENLNGEMVPIGTMSDAELAEIARISTERAMEQRSALRPTPPAGGGALTPPKQTSDYLREAQ